MKPIEKASRKTSHSTTVLEFYLGGREKVASLLCGVNRMLM